MNSRQMRRGILNISKDDVHLCLITNKSESGGEEEEENKAKNLFFKILCFSISVIHPFNFSNFTL